MVAGLGFEPGQGESESLVLPLHNTPHMSEIKKHVHFPMQTRGPVDSDPVIEHDEDTLYHIGAVFAFLSVTHH